MKIIAILYGLICLVQLFGETLEIEMSANSYLTKDEQKAKGKGKDKGKDKDKGKGKGKGKDKGKKGKGKEKKGGGEAEGGDDGDEAAGGDGGDEAGGGGGDEEPQEDPLSYESLMNIMQDLQEQVNAVKEEADEVILNKIQEQKEENIEFYYYLKQNWKQKVDQNLEIAKAKFSELKKMLQRNQLALFALIEVLVDRIRQKRVDEIISLKQAIQNLLLKFPPPISACESLENCEDCLSRSQCVWCSDTYKCYEGSRADGIFFHQCEFLLVESCEFPQSDHFIELPPLKQSVRKMDNFFAMKDLALEQKQYIFQVQKQMLNYKNKINQKRMELEQMHNVSVSIQSKRIVLDFEIKREFEMIEQGQDPDEIDYDTWEEYFLDRVEIDDEDIGLAILKLEEEVEELKLEEEENAEQRQQEEKEKYEEELQRKREQYEQEEQGGRKREGGSSSSGGSQSDSQETKSNSASSGGSQKKRKSRQQAEEVDTSEFKKNESIDEVLAKIQKKKVEAAKEAKEANKKQ